MRAAIFPLVEEKFFEPPKLGYPRDSQGRVCKNRKLVAALRPDKSGTFRPSDKVQKPSSLALPALSL
jgi:hypothetical protein